MKTRKFFLIMVLVGGLFINPLLVNAQCPDLPSFDIVFDIPGFNYETVSTLSKYENVSEYPDLFWHSGPHAVYLPDYGVALLLQEKDNHLYIMVLDLSTGGIFPLCHFSGEVYEEVFTQDLEYDLYMACRGWFFVPPANLYLIMKRECDDYIEDLYSEETVLIRIYPSQ